MYKRYLFTFKLLFITKVNMFSFNWYIYLAVKMIWVFCVEMNHISIFLLNLRETFFFNFYLFFSFSFKSSLLNHRVSSTNENHSARDWCTWKTALWLGNIMTRRPCSLRSHHCKNEKSWQFCYCFCLTFIWVEFFCHKTVKFPILLFYLQLVMDSDKRNKLPTFFTFAKFTVFSLQFPSICEVIQMAEIFLLFSTF